MEDLKAIVGSISKLRNELQTNKKIVPISDGLADSELWNKHLVDLSEAEATAQVRR